MFVKADAGCRNGYALIVVWTERSEIRARFANRPSRWKLSLDLIAVLEAIIDGVAGLTHEPVSDWKELLLTAG